MQDVVTFTPSDMVAIRDGKETQVGSVKSHGEHSHTQINQE